MPFQDVLTQCQIKIRKIITFLVLFDFVNDSKIGQRICGSIFNKLVEDCENLNLRRDWTIHSETRKDNHIEIKGPQPWMLTRRYITEQIMDECYSPVNKTLENNWLCTKQRIDALCAKVYPRLDTC